MAHGSWQDMAGPAIIASLVVRRSSFAHIIAFDLWSLISN
jgi:hypothetical protein